MAHQDDELMQLWQQGASDEPDAKEVARLAGKATMTHFATAIFWRNFREYAGGLLVLGIVGWGAVTGKQHLQGAIAVACVVFMMAYLWWKHRDIQPLDPTADARTYQAAMLDLVDRQIRLLRSVRYWYLLPLYIPPLLFWAQTWRDGHRIAAIVGMAGVTGFFRFVLYLNEGVAVPRLMEGRKRIEQLYKEDL